MKAHLQILSFFTVFSVVLMMSGDVYEGTEGEKVEIRCSYPDDYKYTPKYFCRDPCTSSNVLIKSAKVDQHVSDGRYSFIDTVSGRSFSVTIRDLRRSDSGVYYCGIDKWFMDRLSKVRLNVKPGPAAPVNNPSHTTKNTPLTYIWTTTHTSAFTNSSSQQTHSSSNQPSSAESISSVSVTVFCASVLVLLLFVVLVALKSLRKKRSDVRSTSSNPPSSGVQCSPDHNQTADEIYHIYDEMLIGDSSVIYSTVTLSDPAPQDDSNMLYSLVLHH